MRSREREDVRSSYYELPRESSEDSEAGSVKEEERDGDIDVSKNVMWMFTVSLFLGSLAGQCSNPFLPYRAKSLGASTSQMGYLFAFPPFVTMCFLPFAGRMTDYYGRRPTLILTNTIALLSSIFLAFGNDIFYLVLGQFLVGLCIATTTVQYAWLSDVTLTAESRKLWFSRALMLPYISMGVGGLLGGAVGGYSAKAPYYCDMIFSAINLAITVLFIVETPAWEDTQIWGELQAEETRRSNESSVLPLFDKANWLDRSGLRDVLIGSAVLLLLDGFLIGSTDSGVASFGAIYVTQTLNFSSEEYGVAMAPRAPICIFTNVFLIYYCTQMFGNYGTVIVGGAIDCIVLLAVIVSGSHVVPIMIWLYAVGSMFRHTLVASILARYSTEETRGIIFAIWQCLQMFGRFVAPIVCARLGEFDMGLYPWLYLGVCSGVSMMLVFAARSIQPKHLDSEKYVEQPTFIKRSLSSPIIQSPMIPSSEGSRSPLEKSQKHSKTSIF